MALAQPGIKTFRIRTFRLEFDTAAATPRTTTGEVGGYPVTEKVSLHLTQTAADYAHDAEARCPG